MPSRVESRLRIRTEIEGEASRVVAKYNGSRPRIRKTLVLPEEGPKPLDKKNIEGIGKLKRLSK